MDLRRIRSLSHRQIPSHSQGRTQTLSREPIPFPSRCLCSDKGFRKLCPTRNCAQFLAPKHSHLRAVLVYKGIMQLRRLIVSGLLLAVLMAPALGLALCDMAASPAMSHCSHCAGMSHFSGASSARQNGPASQLPAAPCCRRQAPLPTLGESSAVVVAPMQIAFLPSASPVAALPAPPVASAESLVSSARLASPLSLLCTLRI